MEGGALKVLWGSVASLAGSLAALLTVGSGQVLGEVLALTFAIALFLVICATEGRTRFIQHESWRSAGPGATKWTEQILTDARSPCVSEVLLHEKKGGERASPAKQD